MELFIAVLSLFNTDTCAVSYCDNQPSFGSGYKKNSSSDYYDKKKYKNANDFADYWAEDFEEDEYDSLEDAWDDVYDYWNE